MNCNTRTLEHGTTYWTEIIQLNGYVDYVPHKATTDLGARRKHKAVLRQIKGVGDHRRFVLCYRHDSGATGVL